MPRRARAGRVEGKPAAPRVAQTGRAGRRGPAGRPRGSGHARACPGACRGGPAGPGGPDALRGDLRTTQRGVARGAGSAPDASRRDGSRRVAAGPSRRAGMDTIDRIESRRPRPGGSDMDAGSASAPDLPAATPAAAAPATPGRRLALRGDLLDFTAAPALDDTASAAVRFRPDHWLLVEADGRIAGARPAGLPLEGDWQRREEHRGRLLLPGFVDTHVHSPQIDVIASYGAELLDWLDTYTFPAELRHADEAESKAGAARFLDLLLAHGTTSAVVYPTVHEASAEHLFAAAFERGMRLVAGKVLMDRHAPAGLRDQSVERAGRECERLIDRWHGRGRLAYAVTVRFAPSSTPAQLALAARLCRGHAGTYLQTHVAENRAEVAWVRELFPEARSYLDVYARAGLLHGRSILAHGIWLDDADRAAIRDAGAHVAHCPSSNLFLGSGLYDWHAAEAAGVRTSLASDVGGGTTLAMNRIMGEAYKVQALQGRRLTAWKALHAATLGAAEALGLDGEIGSFEPGRLADACAWDWAAGPLAGRRMAVAGEDARRAAAAPDAAAVPAAAAATAALHERVFAWMTLADDRNLAAAYVAGVPRFVRGAA